MRLIPYAQFRGTTQELWGRVQAFKDALSAHAQTTGMPAPRENDLIEHLARTEEPFEVEPAPPTPAPRVEPTIEERRIDALRALNVAFERATARLTAGYPESEKLSWPKQEAEARAWHADANVGTPYVDALAAARGIPRGMYLQKTWEKVVAFEPASARAIGTRQAGEDAIKAAGDEAAIGAARDAAIAALDVLFA